jgi:hypothetical protein
MALRDGTQESANLLRARVGGAQVSQFIPRDFYVPVPNRSITCGLVEALSMIVIVPVSFPLVFGEKITLIVQFAPGATLSPHVEVMLN